MRALQSHDNNTQTGKITDEEFKEKHTRSCCCKIRDGY